MSYTPISVRTARQRRLANMYSSARTSSSSEDRKFQRSPSFDAAVAPYLPMTRSRSLSLPRSKPSTPSPPPMGTSTSKSTPPRPVTPSSPVPSPMDQPFAVDHIPSTPPRRNARRGISDRSIVSDSADFYHNISSSFDQGEEMPEDERSPLSKPTSPPSLGSRNTRQLNNVHVRGYGRRNLPPIGRSSPSPSRTGAADRGGRSIYVSPPSPKAGGRFIYASPPSPKANDDDVSSLGGIEDHSTAVSAAMVRLKEGFLSSIKPSHMTVSEKGVWNTVQSEFLAMKVNSRGNRQALEKQLYDTSKKLEVVEMRKKEMEKQINDATKQIALLRRSKVVNSAIQQRNGDSQQVQDLEAKVADLQAKHKKVNETVETEREDHDRSVQAIQRVLANITIQREIAVQELQGEISSLRKEKEELQGKVSSENNPATSDDDIVSLKFKAQRAFQFERDIASLQSSLQKFETQCDNLKQEVEQKGGKIVILEQELNVMKMELKRSQTTKEAQAMSLDHTTAKSSKLKKQADRLLCDGDSDEKLTLITELAQKQASLETAKNIIASLESANGSLAIDLRGKVKEKEGTIIQLQAKLVDGQHMLHTLATEVRDLQVKKRSHFSQQQFQQITYQQRTLRNELESAIHELQTAAAIHEVVAGSGGQDTEVIEQINKVLSQSLSSLETTRLTIEAAMTNDDGGGGLSSEVCNVNTDGAASTTNKLDSNELNRHLHNGIRNDREAASTELRQQLEMEKLSVVHLEEQTASQKTELAQLRGEIEKMRFEREDKERQLNTETKNCAEILTKKERELEVLQNTLEVTDIGYISDESEENEVETTRETNTSTEKVERLERALTKAQNDILNSAKNLKAEQHSLATAKEVITSLENSNRSMQIELKSPSPLKEEIELLKDEHEKVGHRMQAKDSELEKLRRRLELCGGAFPVPESGTGRYVSIEESKAS